MAAIGDEDKLEEAPRTYSTASVANINLPEAPEAVDDRNEAEECPPFGSDLPPDNSNSEYSDYDGDRSGYRRERLSPAEMKHKRMYKKYHQFIVVLDGHSPTYDPRSEWLYLLPVRVGRGKFRDFDDDDFKYCLEKVVSENLHCQRDRFNNHTTPLSRLLCHDATSQFSWGLSSPYRIHQMNIVFDIYRLHYPVLPESFSNELSLFSELVVFIHKNAPEVERIRAFYEKYFLENLESDNIELLKFAYVFFKMSEDERWKSIKYPHAIESEPFENIEDCCQTPESSYALLDEFLNSKDAWRICMDFDRQREGKSWVEYEQTEQGTICSILKGFKYIINSRGRKIDLDFLEELHSIATSHRTKDLSRSTGSRFGLPAKNATLRFLLSFDEKYGLFSSLICYPGYLNFAMRVTVKDVEIEPIITRLIKDYSQATQREEASLKDKVIAACELSHALVIMHPKVDGNTRTFTTLLLNKLLMDLGFPPSVFENPNFFDGKTSEEMYSLLKKGFTNFESVSARELPEGMLSTEELIAKTDSTPPALLQLVNSEFL